MMQSIKYMLGMGPKTDDKQLIKEGAIILDVRSKGEFSRGHVKNSINIPVDELNKNLSKLKDKNKSIICCCASGMRSGAAQKILASNGYKTVFNGGSWQRLQDKV